MMSHSLELCAGGYKLPKGQDVMISIYNLHHSPAGVVTRRCSWQLCHITV